MSETDLNEGTAIPSINIHTGPWREVVMPITGDIQVTLPAGEKFLLEGRTVSISKAVNVTLTQGDGEMYASAENLGLLVAISGNTVEQAVTNLVESILEEEEFDRGVEADLVGYARYTYDQIKGLVVPETIVDEAI